MDSGAILGFNVFIHCLDESCQVGEGLGRVKILQIWCRPIGEWLRRTVVSVLEDVEQAVEVLANLEREASLTRGSASTFPANVEKNRPSLIVEELVVDPVSLCEVPSILCVVVIKLLSEVERLECFLP